MTRNQPLYFASLFLWLLVLWLPSAWAAAADAPGRDAIPSAGDAGNADEHLIRIGAGDSVRVEVYGQPDMSAAVYVGDDGTIQVPLVGRVRVANLSPVEAAARVEQALKGGGYLVNPQVAITVTQSQSQRVSVLGEVHTPGRYTIDPNTTVFDLLAQAGGVTENSADVAYISRRDAQGNIQRFPVELKIGRVSEQPESATLQAGDQLFVPRAAQFYIYGEVNTPGMYRIEPGMTVIQAIARAGGLTPRGSTHHIQLKRDGPDGKPVVSHVGTDALVQLDDVIHVRQSIF